MTLLICEKCGAETIKNGYASVWYCSACGLPTATVWEHTITDDGVTTTHRLGAVVA